MKVRDSGMPDEKMWADFFNADVILYSLQINKSVNNLVEVGCGYGPFTIEAARRINGICD